MRNQSLPSGLSPPSGLAQEIYNGNGDPPSPSHTASPPSATSGYLPQNATQRELQLQNSPPQLQQTSSQISVNRGQNRVPPPMLGQNAQPGQPGLSRISDSWVPPDSDAPLDASGNRRKGSAGDERDVYQQQRSPDRTPEWPAAVRPITGTSSLTDAVMQRTSPSTQAWEGTDPTRTVAASSSMGPSRTRPRGPTQTSSSPVSSMMQALRQHQAQAQAQQAQQHQQQAQQHQQQHYSPPTQQPSHPPSASSSQVRGTPPSSLYGLIPPAVNPQIPILGRSQTENPAATAAAAGVRPTQTPPGMPSSYNTGRRDTTSPPGRATNTGSSPSYHTPLDSPPGAFMTANSSMSDINSGRDSFIAPFQYDRDEDQYRQPMGPDSRARYQRDESPPPIHARSLPQAPSAPMPAPPIAQRPPVAPTGGSGASGTGSQIRSAMPRSFPVVHEEFDVEDEVQLPRQAASASRERYSDRDYQQPTQKARAPSPPPAAPVPQQTNIPLYAPQGMHGKPPPVLQAADREATPSPPRHAHGGKSSSAQPEEDLDPAIESSDNFTPKSPNAPLPVDHGYQYSNNNVGRHPSNTHRERSGRTPVHNYADTYGSLQHALFAMQMSGMPIPKGPLQTFQNMAARESYTSLGSIAASIANKPESPYPPPPINTNVNGSSGSTSGYGGSAESGGGHHGKNDGGAGSETTPWDGPDHWNYADFVEYQRKLYSGRPDAPIPPTPHSYASPQQVHPPYGSHGPSQQHDNRNGFGAPAFGNGYGPGQMLDPSMIPDRYIPSALSSYLSSPMMHNPFLPRFPPPQSLVSSPSHIPLDLGPAPIGSRKLTKKKSKRQLRGGGSRDGNGSSKGGKGPSKLSQPPVVPEPEPPRIGAESTVPKESSSEESDTDGTKKGGTPSGKKGAPPGGQGRGGASGATIQPGMETSEDEETEDDDVWLDEDSEDELDAEFHSRYIQNPSKRKRKWEQKWDNMIRLVSTALSRSRW